MMEFECGCPAESGLVYILGGRRSYGSGHKLCQSQNSQDQMICRNRGHRS